MLFIKNAHILPMTGEEIENGCLLIDGGKISAVGTQLSVPEAAEVIDAGGRLVTPGCVEAHCHGGLDNEAMAWEGADFNDMVDPITSQIRRVWILSQTSMQRMHLMHLDSLRTR